MKQPLKPLPARLRLLLLIGRIGVRLLVATTVVVLVVVVRVHYRSSVPHGKVAAIHLCIVPPQMKLVTSQFTISRQRRKRLTERNALTVLVFHPSSIRLGHNDFPIARTKLSIQRVTHHSRKTARVMSMLIESRKHSFDYGCRLCLA